MKKILIIDFDEKYINSQLNENYIVLSSSYENGQTLDVRKFKNELSTDIDEYNVAWGILKGEIDGKLLACVEANEAQFFRGCIGPMSRWFEALNFVLANNDIEEIRFSTYSKNDKIFTYEAEGEVNTLFMYKRYYYLSYFINEHLKNKFKGKIVFEQQVNKSKIVWKKKLRNLIIFNFVILKQFIFRVLVFKRDYRQDKSVSLALVVSSRGIVQSEFISNYQKSQNDSLIIANEQSFRLFKHLRYLKANKISFLYAEGNIGFFKFFSILNNYFSVLFKIANGKKYFINYKGIQINCNYFLKDMVTKDLDQVFYSYSVAKTLKKIESKQNDLKMISFEMFTSYAYYLKRITKLVTFQVQTTLIEPKRNPNFILSDHFYFTNPITYKDFLNLNQDLKDKISCIPYLKYLGTSKKQLNTEIKLISYYTQPIDLLEEQEIIDLLSEYCKERNIKLIIKPHPRQMGSFDQNSNNITIASKNIDSTDLIQESDVVITRSSSIGLDAWVYGVPPIFVKLNSTLQNQNIFYAPNDYLGTVTSLAKLKDVLNNYSNLKTEFVNAALFKEINQNIQNIDLIKILNSNG